MIRVNNFFYYSFIIILLLVFVFGGFIQYFIGIPSTLYSLLILGFIYFLIILNGILSQKISINRISLVCFLYIIVIIISGLVNHTDILKISLYTMFALTPLGVFSIFKILEKRKIAIRSTIVFVFRIIVLMQLPIILIQKYGFDFLIKLNNSNQVINEYDFGFGSFFLRADHSLGFFLLMYLLNILFKYRRGHLNKTPWVIMIYISTTIFIMESNLTKLLLILIFSYYLLIWLYNKISLFGLIVMVFAGYIALSIATSVPAIEGQLYYIKNRYDTKQSIMAYNKGYAKRPQVMIAYMNYFPLKVIGEGPYNYFNIFTGKFKKTKHFSQVIWAYHDLGIIGVIIIILLVYEIIRHLQLQSESIILLFGILLFYSFMTNVYSDLAILFSLIIVSKRNY